MPVDTTAGAAATSAATATETKAAAPVTPAAPAGDAKATETKQAATTTTDTKATETKATPAEYKLKLPEGHLFGDKYPEESAAFYREQGFSAEQAQKLVDREHGLLKGYEEAQQAKITAHFEGLAGESRTFFGEKFGEVAEQAKRGFYGIVDEAVKANPKIDKDALVAAWEMFGNDKGVLAMFATHYQKAKASDKATPSATAASAKKMTLEDTYKDKSKEAS